MRAQKKGGDVFQQMFTCDTCKAVWASGPMSTQDSEQAPEGWLTVRFVVHDREDLEINNRPAKRAHQDACSRECAAKLAEAFAEKLRTG